MKIRFTKMSGAGNDFIFLGPEYAGLKSSLAGLAARLSPRRISVGADGLILVEKTAGGIVMHYFNSDGSEASFCGNGARCLVRYCAEKGIAEPPLDFRTGSGLHRGDLAEEGVRVDMEMPALVRQTTVCVDGREYRVHLVDAGVPHAVVLLDGIGTIDLETVGKKIRWDNAFQPQGANVDFVERSAGSPFGLRTYERGVEKETLACGSGCLASALVINVSGLAGDRVDLKVASGDIITVGLDRSSKDRNAQAFLAGPAAIVYEGEIEVGEL